MATSKFSRLSFVLIPEKLFFLNTYYVLIAPFVCEPELAELEPLAPGVLDIGKRNARLSVER
jgi:hypothetical protein